jgi:2-methylisocitrate lyase-like PEP mutase family enzyme
LRERSARRFVTGKPVNLLINAPFITVAQAAALGVRRISVGGTLARAACDRGRGDVLEVRALA